MCTSPDVARLIGFGIFDLRRAHHDEERVVVALDFRPLVSRQCVFDREVVQAELFLNFSQERLRGFVEANPHECVGPLYHITDVVERHLSNLAAA
jgi:hypothetical protein